MKNNKKLTWFLAAILVGIWSAIAYQVFEAVGFADDEGVETSAPKAAPQNAGERFTFEQDVRDPFQYVVRKERPKEVRQALREVLWVPPPFRLTGIVIKEKRKIAVLETADGATHFVAEGETLGGVTLLKILERTVTYKYLNQTKDWALAQ